MASRPSTGHQASFALEPDVLPADAPLKLRLARSPCYAVR